MRAVKSLWWHQQLGTDERANTPQQKPTTLEGAAGKNRTRKLAMEERKRQKKQGKYNSVEGRRVGANVQLSISMV
jgi:predicted alpha/beta superfamily hydrolase